MNNHHPKLVVITPVRNEAWVLDAFLTCTSSWADHIIVADHHSEDGSREIALKYPKVTLIDNPCQEWVEYECRARLIEEAAKIDGDKIIFALDTDEFLSEGFDQTEGWRHILDSEPNDIFCFNWLNLFDDFHTYAEQVFHAEWACHFGDDVDIANEYRKREHHAVHCTRIPCLEPERSKYTIIDDIRFVHLAKLNHRRTRNKLDFYQVVNIDKNPVKSSPVSMYRIYNEYYPKKLCYTDRPIKLYCMGSDQGCNALVQASDHGAHYIGEIKSIIEREGFDTFRTLCIWDNPDLISAGIKPRIPFFIRIAHLYLRTTQKYHGSLFVRVIDNLLKRILHP